MKVFCSPYTLKVKTINIEYDTTAERGPVIDSPVTVAEFIRTWNAESGNPPDIESFSVFGTDSRHHVISAETLTRGTDNQAPVDPRRLYRHLIAADAKGFIVTHNHPAGVLEFSRHDLELTRRLFKGAVLLGMACHDHILTGDNRSWKSLRTERPDIFTP